MATVNFSVPDEVRDAFNEAFEGRNKSAIIAQLMRDAVEEERRRAVREAAMRALLRRKRPPATDRELAQARQALRK